MHIETAVIGNMQVSVACGNLIQSKADALVVPQFNGGPSEGGVGYAIIASGAEKGVIDEYNAEMKRRGGKFVFGDAFVTPSHGGNTKHLVHVISVDLPLQNSSSLK